MATGEEQFNSYWTSKMCTHVYSIPFLKRGNCTVEMIAVKCHASNFTERTKLF